MSKRIGLCLITIMKNLERSTIKSFESFESFEVMWNVFELIRNSQGGIK